MEKDHKDYKGYEGFKGLISELRELCPWDKKQTFETLRLKTIEEVYELSEAILNNDITNIIEELGDILTHILFYSKIAEEKKIFDINDVIQNIIDKLIRRHPHVFAGAKVKNEQEVLEQWEKIKKNEKPNDSPLPKALPSIIKALKVQQKAAAIGFDWRKKEDSWDKFLEEINELKTEIDKDDIANIKDEFGDVLFALINYARHIKIDPDQALEDAIIKFSKRFENVKAMVGENDMKTMNEADLINIWEKAKLKYGKT